MKLVPVSKNMLDGSAVAEARKKKGWSRAELARQSGLPYHVVNTVEHKLRQAYEHEAEQIMKALGEELDTAQSASLSPGIVAQDPSVERVTEWRGLSAGDPCRITRERGTFHFMYHHTDDRQEYVQVYGPVSGKNPYSKLRSLLPERIRSRTGKKLTD